MTRMFVNLTIPSSQPVDRFDPRDDALSEGLQRDDPEIIERRQSGLERELLDQMRVIGVDDPEERVLERRVVLAEHVVDLVLLEERSRIRLGERYERFPFSRWLTGQASTVWLP